MDTTRKRVNANAKEPVLPKEKGDNNVTQETSIGRDGKAVSPGSPAKAVAVTVFSPALIVTFVLIFGGCCSNVYTLESILSLSPATGSLITFLQFLLTTLFAFPTQLTTTTGSGQDATSSKPSSPRSLLPRIRTRRVPLYKWIIYTAMFLLINVLNNNAFKYRISVPLHIILRSAGPVTSMLVGYLYAGRKYEPRKVAAVVLLFGGVVMAALADAMSKGKIKTAATATSDPTNQLPGFVLLFSALLLSAFMGVYVDNLYRTHGRSTAVNTECLFYSHFLSLPFFAIQFRELFDQYTTMTLVHHSQQQPSSSSPSLLLSIIGIKDTNSLTPLLLLLANALTQIVCITGVNRLSVQTTSLTVSIVLNVRKLVSLLLSIWLFGNHLPPGVVAGAVVVFAGGALYAWPSSTNKPPAQAQISQQGKDKGKAR